MLISFVTGKQLNIAEEPVREQLGIEVQPEAGNKLGVEAAPVEVTPKVASQISIKEQVEIEDQTDSEINVSVLRANNRKLSMELIAPATEAVTCELAPEHAAEPIKSVDEINRISEYLISSGRYRDNMLFIVGINFGLRASDLRMLRFANLINENYIFKDSFPVFEKKTRNTRKRKKNRYITINNAVIEAVTLYLENKPGVRLSDYMFRSESNNGGNKNEPLSIKSIDCMLKGIAKDLDLTVKFSSHSLRKTFGYHQMMMSGNDNRKLLLLQKIFNHSSPAQTLDYIGITSEEIGEAYKNLNLGSTKHCYLMDSNIVEYDCLINS